MIVWPKVARCSYVSVILMLEEVLLVPEGLLLVLVAMWLFQEWFCHPSLVLLPTVQVEMIAAKVPRTLAVPRGATTYQPH